MRFCRTVIGGMPIQSALAILIAMALSAGIATAQTQPTIRVDQYASQRVTKYLHKHRLPVVGAQVYDTADGNRELHLFGFTATPFGKQDAEAKALKYLGD